VEYEKVTQNVLFNNAVLAALTFGRKYNVMIENGILWFFERKSFINMQRRYRTQYGRAPLSDNAIRRRLKQFQETGSVLHRKGAGRLSISQEDVARIQEAFSRNPQESTRQASLQLGMP
jgi:hypothetical protein